MTTLPFPPPVSALPPLMFGGYGHCCSPTPSAISLIDSHVSIIYCTASGLQEVLLLVQSFHIVIWSLYSYICSFPALLILATHPRHRQAISVHLPHAQQPDNTIKTVVAVNPQRTQLTKLPRISPDFLGDNSWPTLFSYCCCFRC